MPSSGVAARTAARWKIMDCVLETFATVFAPSRSSA